jgi:hypothetical protein
MEAFTSAALLMVPSSDYETDDIRTKRVQVFLFGALDALIQQHHISGQEMYDTLSAYLRQTFPGMTPSDIQATGSFLSDASADPEWIPVMRRGGQTMVDWSRGDAAAPSRLLKVVHYGIDD